MGGHPHRALACPCACTPATAIRSSHRPQLRRRHTAAWTVSCGPCPCQGAGHAGRVEGGRSRGASAPKKSVLHHQPITSPLTRVLPTMQLTHVPSSLGGLLKSSFGLLGLQSRPKPGDAPLVLLFVVGGLSAAELRDAREAAAIANASATGAGDGPRVELLLGGTCLLSATDLVTALWD